MGSWDHLLMGPSSNQKDVSCPPAGWAKKGLLELFFSSFPPVHSSFKNLKLGKKRKKTTSRLAVFFPTRPTRNDFLLKGGLVFLDPPFMDSQDPLLMVF